MIILALDFGGSTGWAIQGEKRNDFSGIISGTWDIKPQRGESPGMRYVRLRARLNEIRSAYPPLSLVVYEQAHNRGGAATEYANGCTATLQAWCAEHKIEHVSFHSATIKKFITGGGRAEKNAVIKAVKAKGFSPGSHDEADAIAILLLGSERYDS